MLKGIHLKVCCALFGRQQILRFLIHCLTGKQKQLSSTSESSGILTLSFHKYLLYIQYLQAANAYMDGTDLRLQINLAMRVVL